MLNRLYASVLKETRIITRDREALVLLFVMPLIFILIMSLTMKDVFKARGGVTLPVLVVDDDGEALGKGVVEALKKTGYFRADISPAGAADEETIRKDIVEGRHRFAIIIPVGSTRLAASRVKKIVELSPGAGRGVAIRLLTDPAMRSDYGKIIVSTLNMIFQDIENKLLTEQLARMASEAGMDQSVKRRSIDSMRIFSEIKTESAVKGGSVAAITAVQQSVPAWSLFAMFFLVIPLSVTFVKERHQGSLARLKAMNVPPSLIMAGKIVPYFIINQVQIVLMLLVGRYVVPMLGGDVLEIGNSPQSLAALTFAASIAAIGWGLLVAAFCKTSEQATVLGGTSVIIFGAIGGIMVPKFIMPSFMQKLSTLSPMSWGLEGFLDVFVRNGGLFDTLPRCAALLAFGMVSLLVAAWRLAAYEA